MRIISCCWVPTRHPCHAGWSSICPLRKHWGGWGKRKTDFCRQYRPCLVHPAPTLSFSTSVSQWPCFLQDEPVGPGTPTFWRPLRLLSPLALLSFPSTLVHPQCQSSSWGWRAQKGKPGASPRTWLFPKTCANFLIWSSHLCEALNPHYFSWPMHSN